MRHIVLLFLILSQILMYCAFGEQVLQGVSWVSAVCSLVSCCRYTKRPGNDTRRTMREIKLSGVLQETLLQEGRWEFVCCVYKLKGWDVACDECDLTHRTCASITLWGRNGAWLLNLLTFALGAGTHVRLLLPCRWKVTKTHSSSSFSILSPTPAV